MVISGSISLVIFMICSSKTVFANCVKSGQYCCPGYLWNENRKECERCKSGFIGLSCDIPCPYPSYGLDCQQICNCEKSYCNFQDGCIRFRGCENGFVGTKCLQECPYPSYGKNCQEICSCDNETCNHKHGCLNERYVTSSIKTVFYDRNSSKNSKAITIILSNESKFHEYMNMTITQLYKYLSSTLNLPKLEVTPSTTSTFGSGMNVPEMKTDIINEKTVTSRDNVLLILIISMNTFVILTVCGIIGLCLYCKRRRIFHNIINSDMVKNEYNGNRLRSKELLSQKQSQIERPNVDLEMTGMNGHFVQNFQNDKLMSASRKQERHHQPYEYENDPDPYLVPEPAETDSNYHHYLTVV